MSTKERVKEIQDKIVREVKKTKMLVYLPIFGKICATAEKNILQQEIDNE